mmetsp:Transcript_23928/g.77747  ORF Transcript_23928/g.77747 Transcript_23928/m.77747 type:complete len:201 (-) Transcript_23928:118-720(-)
MVWPMVAAARLTLSGLAAMAVMNMPDDTHEVWKTVVITYAPIFFCVPSSGLEPHARQSALVSGKKMPPARAASDGMAGASSASLNTSEYVSPSVDLPKRLTTRYAMRFPRPVLMKPRARKKAIAISHGISDEKALKAAANGSVPVTIATPSPIIATAPSGSGVVIIPTIVPTKMDSNVQALAVTPAGVGQRYTTMPARMA